ncbi:MAG: DsbA family protein [Acidobacteriales bacterium]|nr:DsbA family protein [Terriglobales bacterium]
MKAGNTIFAAILVLACLSSGSQSAFAQSSNITEDMFISLDGAPSMGEESARVTIVEFSDFQCPLSGRYFNLTMGQLVNEYVKTGQVRYVFRDFPLESTHPQALKAAEGAHCAGEQGKYWEMHDRLLKNQMAVALDVLPLHATVLDLDIPKFRQCLESGRYAAAVRESVTEGQKAGVRGTPAFFLGLTDPKESRLKAMTFVSGAQPYATFKEAIDKLLSRMPEPSSAVGTHKRE